MKKIAKILILFTFVFLMVFFVGCGEKNYTVTFILDGAKYASIPVADGTCLKDIETNVDMIQYDLDGWYYNDALMNENEEIHSDMTLTGYTIDKEYLIQFVNDDDSLLRKNKYEPYETIEVPTNPKKKSDTYYDYQFVGWDQEFDVAKSDMTIRATYEKTDRYYSVKLVNHLGETIKENSVKAGDEITLEELSRQTDAYYSYDFWGWVDETGEFYEQEESVLKDSILTPKYHLTPVKTSAEGLTISIVGDSISTHYRAGDPFNSYYSGENQFFYPRYATCLSSGSQTWWAQTVTKLNAKLGINNSWSGTTCTNNGNQSSASPAENDTRLKTLGENGSPDIIITYIGTNDCVSGRTKEVFYKGYNNMITKIKKMYPNAYVFCITLGYSVYDGGSYSEELRLQYNEAIKEVASNHDATVIDWATIQTDKAYLSVLVDRLHLNLNGMNQLSDLCVKTINEYLGKKK